MTAKAKMTPMMQQYRAIRDSVPPDTILFFRLGDFYEMFFDDAAAASQILDIALTKRNNVPMCGVPYHAADQYLARLVRAGRKVAICDQVEDAADAKGIVRRDITSIITPGTVTVDAVLESNRNNFLAAVYECDDVFGLALMDLSTGDFRAEKAADIEHVRESLFKFGPSECIVPENQAGDSPFARLVQNDAGLVVTPAEDWTFDYDAAYDLLVRHFAVHSLEGFGCEGDAALVGAGGAILYHVRDRLRRQVSHVRSLRVGRPGDYLVIDEATAINLALTDRRTQAGSEQPTLLGVLDCTQTAMGGRLVREWITRPLAGIGAVTRRHDAVGEFTEDRFMLGELRERLSMVRDMERLIARLGSGGGNARDLNSLAQSLESLPELKTVLEGCESSLLRELSDSILPMPELSGLIREAIVEEPPVAVRDGGMIAEGYNADLDELRDAASTGRKWLADYQAREKEKTGIKNLKVRHNKVFGYYIEVSKAQLDSVPEEYVRKQTLVNCERFITPEIKEYENKILGAQERSVELEYEIFCRVREGAVDCTVEIQSTAAAIASLDVLSAFANRALLSRYVRPEMTDDDVIDISDGRHPVIEQMADAERFVPNDLLVDCTENQLLIITGPNMAGKSTYIRQAALLVIMAQMGSFVPAAAARIGIVDRVFTRVGASDDIARGRSTFMVEMQETANILNNATSRSLIVLDEIGRGTSTFDGISIAWAVAEFLHNNREVKARTLFATHYHELTDLVMTMEGVKNYNVMVKEKGDTIVFLRKIVQGPADKSYGIHVARLAGLPGAVIDRAREILMNLEEGEFSDHGKPQIAKRRPRKGKFDPSQMSLFEGDTKD